MRNSYLYRNVSSGNDSEDLVVYEDGTMEIIKEGDITADALKDKGAVQIYSFGPGLVENGTTTNGNKISEMSFLFLWPLILGFIPTRIIEKQLEKRAPGRLTLNIYNSGVAALTVSSLLKGIFDIAGNSSRYQIYLLIFGSIMFITGLFLYIRERMKHTS
jgi:hypothetical protein